MVLADANVLYSRVLRDYLLYAADQGLISVAWSAEILDEMTEHLQANVASFNLESAQRLVKAMNNAFPYAQVVVTAEALSQVAKLGANVMHPDLLLSWLVRDRPDEMRAAHATAVARLRGATDASTISALRRAGAPTTAELIARFIE